MHRRYDQGWAFQKLTPDGLAEIKLKAGPELVPGRLATAPAYAVLHVRIFSTTGPTWARR